MGKKLREVRQELKDMSMGGMNGTRIRRRKELEARRTELEKREDILGFQ